MKTAIFLGAGASAAEGAPMQSNLFKDYFESVRDQPLVDAPPNSPLRMKKELSDFFEAMFSIRISRKGNLSKINFPTFEEALGLLDLAEIRREGFKDYDLEVFGPDGNRIRIVRQFMVLAMAKAISDSLKKSKGVHRRLVRNLNQKRLLKDSLIISTNYDILIDNAVSSMVPGRPGINLDYGVEFTNFVTRDWARPGIDAVRLYKLHGSLNWLYCAICNTVTLTPHVKGVIDLITDVATSRDRAICRVCGSIMTPIIIPPTFYKDMSRVFLSLIWNKAENALRDVNHIIFCGYSFPDADLHLKYLIKRAQANRRDPASLTFTVLNHHAGKTARQVREERSRFYRFLGSKVVRYTNKSFEHFAETPADFYH